MSTGGEIGSAVATTAAATTAAVHDGDADDDTADAGVGGPEVLEYMAGDRELCLLLL